MLQETIEPEWLDAFEAVPGRCGPRHFDLPLRRCTVAPDGTAAADAGRLPA